MQSAATAHSSSAVLADTALKQDGILRPRLWPSLTAAWMRRLDRRIEQDLCWLDHTGALEDFRRASHD